MTDYAEYYRQYKYFNDNAPPPKTPSTHYTTYGGEFVEYNEEWYIRSFDHWQWLENKPVGLIPNGVTELVVFYPKKEQVKTMVPAYDPQEPEYYRNGRFKGD